MEGSDVIDPKDRGKDWAKGLERLLERLLELGLILHSSTDLVSRSGRSGKL